MRIVSVCPSNTDLLEHLGALDMVIARDTWSDWPQRKVQEIPLIGSVLNINYEKIDELKPDLILASKNVPGMDKVVNRLESMPYELAIFDPECWDDVIQNLEDLGQLIDHSKTAKRVINEASVQVDELKEQTGDDPEVSLCIEWWADPIFVPFGRSYVNQVLSWVNVINPFEKIDARSGKLSKEQIIERKPDMYAVSWCGTPWAEYNPMSVYERYKDFEAPFTKNQTVFSLWEGIIGHPSLRLLDGARQILNFRRQVGI